MGRSATNVLRFPDAQARGGCLIGTDVTSGAAVYLQPQGLIHIPGVSGSGKTTTLHHLIQADLIAGRGLAVVEPHGDLVRAIIATMPEQRVPDVVLLNLMDCGEEAFGLNIFERPTPYTPTEVAKTASQVFRIFETVWGLSSATPNLGMTLRHVTRTLIDNRATFAEIPLLLQEEDARERMVKRVTSPHTKAFWAAYERRSHRDKLDLVGSLLNRADAYMQEGIAPILSQERSTVDFRAIMDSGKVLLVLLSPQLTEMSRLTGTMVIAGILRAAFSRADTPEDQRRLFSLYIDEFQNFMTDDTATLIHESRKFHLSPICLAHQDLGQLTEACRTAVSGASTRITFRVSPESARAQAAAYDTTPTPGKEVIGYDPIRSPTLDPLGFLTRHSHPHPDVARFVSEFLRPLDTLREKLIGYQHLFPFGCVELYPPRVIDGQQIINRALAEAMQTGRADGFIWPLGLFVLGGSADPGMTEIWWTHLKKSVLEPGAFIGFRESANDLGRGDFLENRKAVSQLLWEHDKRRYRKKGIPTPAERFVRMLRLLRQTMEILAKEPILVETGQYQPKYQQRTYADMVGERANELSAKLPNYHARVRLPSGEEHVVKTHPAPQGLSGDRLAARITRIKRLNRFVGITRPAAEIAEEIRARHERLRGGA